jgi:hypothetical protein
MDKWLEWELKGSFRIHIPADAQPRLDDDGTTAVIRLGSNGDISEVLMSNFPLKNVTEDRTELAIQLRDLADDFFSRAVPKALGHEIPFNVEVTEEPEGSLYWAQGVSAIGPQWQRVWVARFYARRGERRFWIMHWNGPRDNLETIMRIFVSFEPEESSFNSEA